MYRTHNCGELRAENAGQTVTLAGWVQRVRKMGGMSFIDLRDRYGITQLRDSTCEEVAAAAAKLGREYVIQATGIVEERQSKNAKIATGDIELKLTGLKILNEAQTPPFTIEDESDGGEDIRARYRYLDLRRNPLKNALMLWNKYFEAAAPNTNAQQNGRRMGGDSRINAAIELWYATGDEKYKKFFLPLVQTQIESGNIAQALRVYDLLDKKVQAKVQAAVPGYVERLTAGGRETPYGVAITGATWAGGDQNNVSHI